MSIQTVLYGDCQIAHPVNSHLSPRNISDQSIKSGSEGLTGIQNDAPACAGTYSHKVFQFDPSSIRQASCFYFCSSKQEVKASWQVNNSSTDKIYKALLNKYFTCKGYSCDTEHHMCHL